MTAFREVKESNWILIRDNEINHALHNQQIFHESEDKMFKCLIGINEGDQSKEPLWICMPSVRTVNGIQYLNDFEEYDNLDK